MRLGYKTRSVCSDPLPPARLRLPETAKMEFTGGTPAKQPGTWEELDSILQEKLTFNTFSFYHTRTVEDELLLTKPFQKERHGQVAHKQVAADLLDRCGVLV